MYKLIVLVLTFFLFQQGMTDSQWMDEQISADLAPFQNGITPEMLATTEKVLDDAHLPFMRCRIVNNKIQSTLFNIKSDHPRIVGFVNFLNKLCKFSSIPDVDFIVEFNDSFENKSVLEKIASPVFCMCKKKQNSKGVLYPDTEYFSSREELYKQVIARSSTIPWERKIPKALWRGNPTGGGYHLERWRQAPRSNLVFYAQKHPDILDCAFRPIPGMTALLLQEMLQEMVFKEAMRPSEQLAYRYLIAIDGNSFPSSQKWQLFSKCLLLKNESDYIEWFDRGLIPYRHFVPFRQDSSNLSDLILWMRENDALMKEIANNAQEFAKENLMDRHTFLYCQKLFASYSALQLF